MESPRAQQALARLRALSLSSSRHWRWAALAVLLLAALLRLGRAALRWEEVALAYAAYQEPVVAALGEPARLVGSFVGLHPPLYGVCFALMEHLAPLPVVFLLFSAACSWLAVLFALLAGRLLGGPLAGLLAAALAATAPVALHYAAELNNYPLLQAELGALLWLWARHRRGLGGWAPLALVGVAAGWTHLLGGAFAGLVALAILWRHPAHGLRILALMAVGCSPVLAGAWRLMQDSHTFGQPELHLDLSLRDWRERFGWICLAAGFLALPGLRRAPAMAVVWVGLAATIAAMVYLGVAAPHQFPYMSLLMPAGVLLVALGSSRPRWLALGAIGLALLQAGLALRSQQAGLRRIVEDQGRLRAVDEALAAAEPGDALWLISPALEPDDDKRAISPVLWRLRPWRSQPIARPFLFQYTDYRFGQPRRYGQLTVYSFTDFWPARMDAILAHHTQLGNQVFVALYDHGPAADYPARLRKLLRPWAFEERQVGMDSGLGRDWLLVVSGLAAEGSS